MPNHQRRAYICTHRECVPPLRRFVGPKDPIPHCGTHGKMTLQRNVPYTRPEPDHIPDPVPVEVPRRVPKRPAAKGKAKK